MPIINESELDPVDASSFGGRAISESELDPEPTFLGNIAKSFASGTSQMGQLLSSVMPGSPGQMTMMLSLADALGVRDQTPEEALFYKAQDPAQQLEAFRQEKIGNAVPRNAAERILNKGVEYLPSAILSGGGGLLKSAGTSLISGLGGGAAIEAGLPEWLGAIGAPLASAGVINGAGYIKDTIAPNLPTQADDLTRALLQEKTNAPKILAALERPPSKAVLSPQNVRVAEQVKDPGLALITKTLEKTETPAAIRGAAMDAERAAVQNLFYDYALGPKISAENAGKAIRTGLEEGSESLTKAATGFYDVAKQGAGTAPIQKVKIAVSNAIAEAKDLRKDIPRDVMNAVEALRDLPANASLKQLDAQRQNFGSLVGTYRKMVNAGPAEKTGERIAAVAFGALDDAEKFAMTPVAKGRTKTGVIKGLEKQQVKAIEKGRELIATRGELYGRDAAQDILQKEAYGAYKLNASDVPAKALSGVEEARQVMTGLKKIKATQGIEAAQHRLLAELKRRSTSQVLKGDLVSTEFNPGSFAKNWENIKPVAAEVLNKDQIKAVNQVTKDLLSRAKFEDLASRASRGQSVTAQHKATGEALKDAIAAGAMSKVPLVSNIMRAVGIVKGDRAVALEKLVNENLIEVAFDINAARRFYSPTNTAPKLRDLASDVLTKIAGKGAILQASSTDKDDKRTQKAAAQIASIINKKIDQRLANPELKKRAEIDAAYAQRDAIAERIPSLNRKGSMGDLDLNKLTEAVIKQESGGKVNAISNVGAQGLMQLMPDTGKELFQKYRTAMKDAGVESNVYAPFNADQNRFLGTMYLRELLKQFNNDPKLALTAYHSGPGRVAKLLKKHGATTFEEIQQYLGPIGQKYAMQVIDKMGKQKATMV